jgi:hypothetical protein
MLLLPLIGLPFAICKSYILSLKEGHSAETFDSLVNSLVSKGSTITQSYTIFHGVAIEIPNSLLIDIDMTELSNEIDIEEDGSVSILESMRDAGFGP